MPAVLRVGHHIGVVHDLFSHVDRSTAIGEQLLHRLDGSLDADAEGSWRREQNSPGVLLGSST
jgi:hypothetical protein